MMYPRHVSSNGLTKILISLVFFLIIYGTCEVAQAQCPCTEEFCFTQKQVNRCNRALDELDSCRQKNAEKAGQLNECRKQREKLQITVKDLDKSNALLEERPTDGQLILWTVGGFSVGVGAGFFISAIAQ